METTISVEEHKKKGKSSGKSRKRSNPVEPEAEIASVDVSDDVEVLKVAEIDGNKEKKIEKLRKALKNDLLSLKVELHQMLHQDLVTLVDQSSETRINTLEKQQPTVRSSHSLDSTVSEPAAGRLPSEIINLNVGGVEYTTSRSTLTKYASSMLGVLFSGRFAAAKDDKGRYFIDRDGLVFRHILSFLRTDNIPSIDINNEILIRELIHEAEYFQLQPLLDIIKSRVKWASEYHESITAASLTATPTSPNPGSVSLQVPTTPSGKRLTPKRGAAKIAQITPTATYTRKEIHALKVQHLLSPDAKIRPLNIAGIDLPGLDLSRLDLSYTDFSRCNLQGVNFDQCVLVGCNFTQCNLRQASFQQANFGSIESDAARFIDADLRGTNFTRYFGVLYRAHFEGAYMENSVGFDPHWLR